MFRLMLGHRISLRRKKRAVINPTCKTGSNRQAGDRDTACRGVLHLVRPTNWRYVLNILLGQPQHLPLGGMQSSKVDDIGARRETAAEMEGEGGMAEKSWVERS